VTQATPWNETSKILCRQSFELCRTAKATCLKSQHACLESKHAREASAVQRLFRKNYSALNRTGSSLKVTIFLDGDSYECLLKHVGRQALSRTVIDATVQLGNTRVVDCDDVEARDLLGKARSECPGAVRRITEAMLSAGLTP